MTDHFALLDQPRRPWLDPDELKQTYHAKSLELHPDAQRQAGAEAAFAQLNEAYQLLQDPKRRIHHLLALEGRTPPRDSAVPDDLADLFPLVAQVTQQADAIRHKVETATAPLTRSLLKSQIVALQNRTAETLQRLRKLHADAITASQRLSMMSPLGDGEWLELQHLYLRFSYLGRWIAELEEKQTRLASA